MICRFCAWRYHGPDWEEQARIHELIHPKGVVKG